MTSTRQCVSISTCLELGMRKRLIKIEPNINSEWWDSLTYSCVGFMHNKTTQNSISHNNYHQSWKWTDKMISKSCFRRWFSHTKTKNLPQITNFTFRTKQKCYKLPATQKTYVTPVTDLNSSIYHEPTIQINCRDIRIRLNSVPIVNSTDTFSAPTLQSYIWDGLTKPLIKYIDSKYSIYSSKIGNWIPTLWRIIRLAKFMKILFKFYLR